MSDASIKIVIGASADASVGRVFMNIRSQANQTAAYVGKRMGSTAGMQARVHAARKVHREERVGARSVSREQAREASADFKMREKYIRQEANARIAAHRKVYGQHLRMEQRMRQDIMRFTIRGLINKGGGGRGGHGGRGAGGAGGDGEGRGVKGIWRKRWSDRFANRMGQRMWPTMPMLENPATRLGLDVMRGIGYDMSVSSVISGALEERRLAMRLSNLGYDPGVNERIPTENILKQSRALAVKYGIEGGAAAVIGGGSEFTKQRGNLSGWMQLAPELMRRASAFDVDPALMGHEASKIESALENSLKYADEKTRYQGVLDTLDNLLYQEKVGSVDAEDQAKQLAKIAGMAPQFGLDPAMAIRDFMAVIQMSERGLAPNPATAGTFAKNLGLELMKGKDIFKKEFGIDLFRQVEGINGKSYDIVGGLQELLVQIIERTADTDLLKKWGKKSAKKNQMQRLRQLFPNMRSYSAMQQLLSFFTGSGGDIERVKQEFAKFTGGSITEHIDKMEKNREETGGFEKRVNAFNQTMKNMADAFLIEIGPNLPRIESGFASLAEKLGGFVQWLSEDPITNAIKAAFMITALRGAVETGVSLMFSGLAGIMMAVGKRMFGLGADEVPDGAVSKDGKKKPKGKYGKGGIGKGLGKAAPTGAALVGGSFGAAALVATAGAAAVGGLLWYENQKQQEMARGKDNLTDEDKERAEQAMKEAKVDELKAELAEVRARDTQIKEQIEASKKNEESLMAGPSSFTMGQFNPFAMGSVQMAQKVEQERLEEERRNNETLLKNLEQRLIQILGALQGPLEVKGKLDGLMSGGDPIMSPVGGMSSQ